MNDVKASCRYPPIYLSCQEGLYLPIFSPGEPVLKMAQLIATLAPLGDPRSRIKITTDPHKQSREFLLHFQGSRVAPSSDEASASSASRDSAGVWMQLCQPHTSVHRRVWLAELRYEWWYEASAVGRRRGRRSTKLWVRLTSVGARHPRKSIKVSLWDAWRW